jgi:hypothetical protein
MNDIEMNRELKRLQQNLVRGTVTYLDFCVDEVLDAEHPAYVTLEDAKLILAFYWLRRPKSFFTRIVWAIRLIFVRAA